MQRLTHISMLAAVAIALGAAGAAASIAVDEEEVVFSLADTTAASVYVVGDFNGWNPTIDRLTRSDGGFETRLFLVPGRYRYRFIVDGVSRSDPGNPFVDAEGNSCFILVERDGALEVLLTDEVAARVARQRVAVAVSGVGRARVTGDGVTLHGAAALGGSVDERSSVEVGVGVTARQHEGGAQSAESALLRGSAAYRFEWGVLSAFTRSGRVGLDDPLALFGDVGPFRYPLSLFCRGFSFAGELPLRLGVSAVYASRIEGYRSGLESGPSVSGLFSKRDPTDADLLGGSLGTKLGRVTARYLFRQDRRPNEGSWRFPNDETLYGGFERARFQGFSMSVEGEAGLSLEGEYVAGATRLVATEQSRVDETLVQPTALEREWERGRRFMLGVAGGGERSRLRAGLSQTTLDGDRSMRDGRDGGERTVLGAALGTGVGSLAVDVRGSVESYSSSNTGSVFWLARTNFWLDGDELTCDRLLFLSARQLMEWNVRVALPGDSLRGIPRGSGLRVSFLERRELGSSETLFREVGLSKGLRLVTPVTLLLDMRAVSYRYAESARDFVDAYLALHAEIGGSLWCCLGCGVSPYGFDSWLFSVADHGRSDYLLDRGVFGILREHGESSAARALLDAEEALAEDFMITFEAGYAF